MATKKGVRGHTNRPAQVKRQAHETFASEVFIYYGFDDSGGNFDCDWLDYIDFILFPAEPRVGDVICVDFDVDAGPPRDGYCGQLHGVIVRREWFAAPEPNQQGHAGREPASFVLVLYVKVSEQLVYHTERATRKRKRGK